MKKYIYLWFKVTSQLTQIAFASRLGVVLFTLGKIIRFVFFIVFLYLLISRTQLIAGFTLWQVMMFFLTFNLIDIISQFLWRDVYRFRSYIISGNFDMVLTKPLSPLLRSLFGGSDILDLITLIPLGIFIGYVLQQIGTVTPMQIILYVLMVCNGLVIAMSLHILVLSLGIITTEVDNAIWMFRELTQLGRLPLQIYPKPLTIVFTFILPVAAMITLPTQAILGLLSSLGVVISLGFSIMLLCLSLYAWRGALKRYSSASS